MKEYTAYLETDGTIKFPGIDWSNRKPLRVLTIEFGRDDVLVVKHSGGTCWSGVGQSRDYVPSKFLVFKILSKTKAPAGLIKYKLEMLVEIPTKAK